MAMVMAQEWDLSHLDERLEKALGRFRRDFEGGALSPQRLGPKFGLFGSFLPMYKINKPPTLLPAKPAVSGSICFSRNRSENAEDVKKADNKKPAIISANAEADEKFQRGIKRMLVRDDEKRPLKPAADEKIQRGTKRARALVREDERRPLKTRIVHGSEKSGRTESVPEATVEKRSAVVQPLKIRIVFGSEKRAAQKSIVAN